MLRRIRIVKTVTRRDSLERKLFVANIRSKSEETLAASVFSFFLRERERKREREEIARVGQGTERAIDETEMVRVHRVQSTRVNQLLDQIIINFI